MTYTGTSRRAFLAHSLASAAGLLVGPALLRAAGEESRRPNVLFIITDDQKLDAFGFIRKKALTPNIDRLAAEGVYFSRGYVSSSVCTPSRYTCLTGQYASRAQSENFRRATTVEGQTSVQWNVDLLPNQLTLPKMLQQAGYVTGIAGKWHNGGGRSWRRPNKEVKRNADPADPETAAILQEGQEALHEHVKSCGFNYAAGVNLGNFGAHVCRELRVHNQDWITKGALDFIEQNRTRPFFLYMATSLMHGPSPLKSLNADPRLTHAGVLKEPLRVQPSRQSVSDRAKAAGISEKLAPATWLDDGIGAVLKRLDELGLTEDTLVVFLNDHGVEQGKGSCYEGGVRTPIIIRWPGRIRPGTSKALIQNIDFAPTILDACGVTPPAGMDLDGKTLMPLLTRKAEMLRDSLYFEIGYTRAVCTDRWKYLAFRIPPSKELTLEQRKEALARYAAQKKRREDKTIKNRPEEPLSHMGYPGGQNTERGNAIKRYAGVYYDRDQLFDLETDPGETKNLAADPAHAEQLAAMKALLTQHLQRVPGTFAELKAL
ncbi:MAG: sulfatase-like hydrolase/transferase [Lentisphaerae bacterium]|nr:sulfatase-like hydrolase/transferase [Lentisphaerota bacterium]MBT4821686.1 sulfatase-like hydrolase/transferase [Lentisphaerota bacterium]MBT5609377.1 sulfatase-like hydrolase/transferase [Lentisphaerota bacterium]MBT7060789.1 sulfatase-like hydrolase/transferase [Lentisphaerota bacterium]MBT7843496.1 sulfatase-like hydrolase/transferase [Lentisphaerota bacterium]